MDPNRALNDMLTDISVFWNQSTPPTAREAIAEAVIERFQDLHDWITKGGYLPDEWQPSPELTTHKGMWRA